MLDPARPEAEDTLMTVDEVADLLRRLGTRLSRSTLVAMRSRGGSAPFVRFGGKILYRRGDVIRWRDARLTAPVTTTARREAA